MYLTKIPFLRTNSPCIQQKAWCGHKSWQGRPLGWAKGASKESCSFLSVQLWMPTCKDLQDTIPLSRFSALLWLLEPNTFLMWRVINLPSESQGSRLQKEKPLRPQLQICQLKSHLPAYQPVSLHKLQVYFICPSNTPFYNMVKPLEGWKTVSHLVSLSFGGWKSRCCNSHSGWSRSQHLGPDNHYWRKHLTAAVQ